MKKVSDSALKVAEFLLQIKAVRIQPKKPFTWASGLQSPIYCDNRKTLSFPKIRTYIRQQFCEIISSEFTKPDIIAGVATGGIAHGALVAEQMQCPFVYVRSSKKEHGLNNQIEGVVGEKQSVIVVEDLISTGKSSMNAVHALREGGCSVKGVIAIFSYGLDASEALFREEKCPLFTLTNYKTLVQLAAELDYIHKDEIALLERWREHPESWNNTLKS